MNIVDIGEVTVLKYSTRLALLSLAIVGACSTSSGIDVPTVNVNNRVPAGAPSCIDAVVEREVQSQQPVSVSVTLKAQNTCSRPVAFYYCAAMGTATGCQSPGNFNAVTAGPSEQKKFSLMDMPSRTVKIYECPAGYVIPSGLLHLDCGKPS